MDVVTLGQARAQADKRYPRTGTQAIATRMLTGEIGTANIPSDTTFQVSCELAQHFDAVRIIFASAATYISDVVQRVKVSTVASAADLNNSAGTWVLGAKSGMAGFSTPVAPASGRVAYTHTDWIPVSSLPRTDAGTKPILLVRALVTGSPAMTCYGAASDYSGWATRTDGALWAARQQTGNAIDTPSLFTATTAQARSPIIAIQYLARGKVVTVGSIGDSITQGLGTFAGDGFVGPACRAISSMSGVAVEHAQFGWAGQSSTQFANRALDLLGSEICPDVLVLPSGSPNDTGTTITAATITAAASARLRTLAACADNKVAPVLWTWLPSNTAAKAFGASDALRVADNSDALALATRGGLSVVDTAPLVSGATTSGQVQYAGTMSTDGLHPNATGNAALTAAIQPAIQAAVNGALGSAKLSRRPRQLDLPSFTIGAAASYIAEAGTYLFSTSAAAPTASMCGVQPAGRAAGQQLFFLKNVDTAANPVTVNSLTGDQFYIDGTLKSSFLLLPGEGAVLVTDGSHWVPLMSRNTPYTGFAAPCLVGTYNAGGYGVTTAVPAEGIEHASEIVPARTCTVDALAANVTAAGTAGAVVRLALRADDGTRNPGALIVDAGTISGSVAAIPSVALATPVTLFAGVRYWMTATVQGAATTRPTLAMNNTSAPGGMADASAAVVLWAANAGSVSTVTRAGALAATTTWMRAAVIARVAIHVSA